jgi:hypothetical protein
MKTNNIQYVIDSRLKMQSVQRYMIENFGIDMESCNDLNKFSSKIKSLNEKQMSKFIRNLGGPVNINKTKEFINTIIK